MRTVIDNYDYIPQEIQPAELLAEYQRLVQRDLANLIARNPTVRVAACPACGASASRRAFARYGLDYSECVECGSLWVPDRLSPETVRSFYRDSEAERFWQERLARVTAAARIERIVKPRLEWMMDTIQEHRPKSRSLADVGTQLEAFAQSLSGLESFERVLAIEPLARTLPAQIEVVDQPLETLGITAAFDVVTLFDVLDRTSDVEALIDAVRRVLQPGGLVFITGMLASGFDIQTLWDRAEAIFPPDRLNVFSVKGLSALLARHDFEVLEFSTPGAFDVKSVARALERDPNLPLPRFVSVLLRHCGEDERQRFQSYLQSALLSSFGRVAARKRV
jgi:hypothetical protein